MECYSNLNGRRCHRFLQYHVLPGLHVWNGGNLNRLWWQQDDATGHVTNAKMRYVDRQSKGRVISRREVQKSWPHMSFLHF